MYEKMGESAVVSSDQHIERLIQSGYQLEAESLESLRAIEQPVKDVLQLPGAGTKVVSIVGGAASGKTIFARRFVDALNAAGHRADTIGTDDYVVGDRAYRRTHFEGKDPKAKYDFNLLNRKIADIKSLDGQQDSTIGVPIYNEATGEAIAAGEENYAHQVGKVEFLIVEGDFHEVEQPDLVVYLHMSDEARLANRLARDVAVGREADHSKTTESFHLRQTAQHFPHTLPASDSADVLIVVHPGEGEWGYDFYRRV